MKTINSILLIAGVFLSVSVKSQCLQETVQLSDTLCINQEIVVDGSLSFDEITWDFCAGDLLDTPELVESKNIPSLNRSRDITVVNDNGNWHGFILNRSGNSITRLDFGSNLDVSIPEPINLGNVGSLLSLPESIAITQESGNWLALLINATGELIRIDFGSSLSNSSPTAVTVLTGLGDTNSTLELVEDDSNKVVVITNFASNTLTRVNFESSFFNMPSEILETSVLSNANQIIDISMIKDCGIWYGLIASFNNRKILLAKFENGLLEEPIIIDVTSTFPSSNQPYRSMITFEEGIFIGFVQSITGNLFRFEFENSLDAILDPEIINFGNFNQLQNIRSLSVIKDSSKWHVFTIDEIADIFYHLEFPNNCSVDLPILKNSLPIDVSYTEPGTYSIFAEGVFSDQKFYIQDSVYVRERPIVAIQVNQTCTAQGTNFFDKSLTEVGILNYHWDFDDPGSGPDNISNLENPTHVYQSPGSYDVSLTVTDLCDQISTMVTAIVITDAADLQANFDQPSLICSNSEIQFTDISTFIKDDPVSWEWDFAGLGTSTDQNPVFVFNQAGDFDIALTVTGVSGCEKTIVKNITVLEGPNPSFLANNVCIGSTVEFVNGTVGEVSSYLWDFDNGFTSNLENPSFEFTDPGSYNVSLTAENSLGCIITYENVVTVHSSPEVLFTNDLSCELNLTQFNDFTTVADANIAQWAWEFGDPSSDSNTSPDQNATHIFSTNGPFDVKLVTTSIFGCKDSLTQTVNVLDAPTADFSFDKACLGESIQLENTSTPVSGESITSFEWDIAGTFSNQENPSAVFNTPDDFDVSLFVTSENLCLGSVTKTINIAQPPDLQIGTGVACDNELVKFFDISLTNGDPISVWEWNFGNLGTASDSVAFFDFVSAGSYDVGLSVTTENGCEFSVQDQVIVNQAPEAIFEMSPTFGAPPLLVSFENNSLGANDYFWNFDGESQSSDENPSFVYEELGEYTPELVVVDNSGCRDTVNQRLFVLIPELELELLSLIIPDGQDEPIVVSLRNNGSLVLNQMKALIDLGGEVVLEEEINTELLPGQVINYPLELKITDRAIDYLCVEVISSVDGISESNPEDNVLCHNFFDDLVITDSYPNPADGFINIDVVSTNGIDLDVRVLNSLGGLVKRINFGLTSGKQVLQIDLKELRQGLYFVQIPQLNSTQRLNIRR